MSDFSFVQGKTVVVTGSTSGIGEAIAEQLAGLGCKKVVLVGRNKAKAEVVETRIKQDTGVETQIVLGDLATTEGALSVAKQIKETCDTVGVFVNNAGIWLATTNERRMSPDGITERTYQVNFMSMVLLLTELRDLFAKSKTRVIITGSFTAFSGTPGNQYPRVDFENLQGETCWKKGQ